MSSVAPRGRAQAMRRYPALAFLVVAGFLATLLPSALRLPLSGPTQAAELAPVPGEGDGQEGDLSELGLGSSAGLGAGGGGSGGGAAPTTVPAPAGTGANPRTKRCVGKPPRQTEDPFSPPCVAYYEGDNGGTTAKGVTRDEVVVVVHLGLAATRNPAGLHDLLTPPAAEDNDSIRVGKAYNRYFNDRYQFYGRRLHLYGFYGNEGPADIVAIDEKLDPFGFAKGSSYGSSILTTEAAARNWVTSSHSSFPRATYRDRAPYLVSFIPDVEDQAGIAGSYICKKLAGGVVRWSGDRAMRGRSRVFGLFWQDHAPTPSEAAFREALKSDIQRRCDLRFRIEIPTPKPEAGTASAGYAAAVGQFRDAGVTTLVMATGSGATNNFTISSGSQGYLPEFFIPGGGAGELGPDRNTSGRLNNQAAWEGAFGLTFEPRRDPYQQQPWYRAFLEGCQGCAEPAQAADTAGRMYDLVAMLSYGLQAAGPKLTPDSFDRGMHSIPQRGSASPYAPAAYFAPGNYSFVKDAAEIWWDPQGQEPGWSQPGCYRMVRDGARFRAGEWQGTDQDLFRAPAPCQILNQRPTA